MKAKLRQRTGWRTSEKGSGYCAESEVDQSSQPIGKHLPTQSPKSTVVTRMAVRLIEDAGNSYARNHERGEVESWMAGDPAPHMFEDVCTVLRIKDLDAVRQYIRNYKVKHARSRFVACDQAKLTDGALATYRERFNIAGNP